MGFAPVGASAAPQWWHDHVVGRGSGLATSPRRNQKSFDFVDFADFADFAPICALFLLILKGVREQKIERRIHPDPQLCHHDHDQYSL